MGSQPHSEPFTTLTKAENLIEQVRIYLTWVPPDHAKAATAAIDGLEEQLEAAHEALTDVANVLGSWLPSESSEALRKRVERALTATGNAEPNPASSSKLEMDPGPAEDAFGV